MNPVMTGLMTLASVLNAHTQSAADRVPFANLAGVCRRGQIFLTWREDALPAGATVNVYVHDRPIAAAGLASARLLARGVERHSARDWWQDPASFEPGAESAPPVGWDLGDVLGQLDPAGGLFVHTVTPATAGPRYYAVTWTDRSGTEHTQVTAGANATEKPVTGTVALFGPIWQGAKGTLPAENACRGRRLVLSLHGRGGGATAGRRKNKVNCLWFADATQGWREGLPFKFNLSVGRDTVSLTPMDRVWVGRPVTESWDRRDHCPAINTWWYGYNERIHRTTLTRPVIAPNYTERCLLALVRWAVQYLGCDPDAVYIKGGSMGGSGTVAMVLHHPQVFAAAFAAVPVYSCTRPGKGSARRLECACGPLGDRPAFNGDGVPLLEYMNGARNMLKARADVPPLFATNGRRDGSIPWENNPPFYAAADRARQAFAVYWNNGHHGMTSDAPNDVRAWGTAIYRYRRDRSYPVFTNCSDNRDCGDGDPADGDLVGWINRGMAWRDIEDTPARYAITVTASHPDIRRPVVVDVTIRRRQHFRPAPGERLQVRVGQGEMKRVTVDDSGLFTVTGVRILNDAGTRIVITAVP